jgi:anti-sigma regulatory factor (Ser/Thr protein kinase)
MTGPGGVASTRYSHDLLLHDSDDDLVTATRAFVELGLASGGQVLVHSSEERVDLLRAALGSHPRLDYGLDRDLYLSPMSTLFAYERKLAAEPVEMWVTGTVPLGGDPAGHAAWTRYESLVNEVLGCYAFHALCTYDTRALPARTLAAAKAAHPGLSIGGDCSRHSADYLEPAAFLTDPLAGVPDPAPAMPSVVQTLHGLDDLSRVRHLMTRTAESSGAVPRDTVEGFVTASNEILVNALTHGAAPVELVMWVDLARLTCRITDAGPGIPDTLTGYRYPGPVGPKGLWVARQVCEDVILSNRRGGGCSVLLATA